MSRHERLRARGDEMLSREQQVVMRLTVAIAEDLAREGFLVAGYDCLLRGLHAALRDLRDEKPGAVELVLRYHFAVEEYCLRYGVRGD